MTEAKPGANQVQPGGNTLKSSRSMIRKRRELLLSLIYRFGNCDVSYLASKTGVSEATIRRDLAALESQGAVDRQWGGAAMRAEVNYRSGFKHRLGQRDLDKQSIALAAAEMVEPNMVIALSGGTTCTQLAWALWNKPTSIVTNAVNIAIEMHTLRRARIILTGGVLRANSYELVGSAAADALLNYGIERFFFSCSGVSERGFTRRDEAEATIVRAFIAASRHSVMLIDDTKLGRDHDSLVASFGDVQTIMCNDLVSEEWQRRMASGGAEVRVVPRASAHQLEQLQQVEARGSVTPLAGAAREEHVTESQPADGRSAIGIEMGVHVS